MAQRVMRDSTDLRPARDFAIGKPVAIGRSPCELPLAILTPTLGSVI